MSLGAAHAVALVAGSVGAAHLVPSVGTIPVVHRRLLPALAGRSRSRHVALTFDDGPDPASTPDFLDTLDRLDVRATFFLLGRQLAAAPDLGREIADRGHEVAVHGWTHDVHLLRTPWAVAGDIARTRTLIRETTGRTAAHWRPPNGILSGAGLLAARRYGLRPVLWTTDGHDWAADATPDTVLDRVTRRLGPGGTVLLHDSDITSAPGSWRATLGALPRLVQRIRDEGWPVGPLREHWSVAARPV